MPASQNRVDLTGRRFGRLVVVGYAETKGKRAIWLCLCDCGTKKLIASSNLQDGTKSCGCIRREMLEAKNYVHGVSGDKFYPIWRDMMNRCYSTKNKFYKDYGGRGIIVCEPWKNSPGLFIEWCQAQSPIKDGFSIDRFPDLNGPYSPDNCRFASSCEQNRNMRSNVWVEYDGQKLIFKDFVSKYGVVSYDVAKKRVRLHGFNHIDAALTPAYGRERRKK